MNIDDQRRRELTRQYKAVQGKKEAIEASARRANEVKLTQWYNKKERATSAGAGDWVLVIAGGVAGWFLAPPVGVSPWITFPAGIVVGIALVATFGAVKRAIWRRRHEPSPSDEIGF